MENNKKKNLDSLNRIFNFLGPHGGSISIENDWTFYCRVNDLGDGDYEAELYSMSDEDEGALMDPLFRIDIWFDADRTKITDYRANGFLSQWWGGELRIDRNGNSCDSAGHTDYDENNLDERLFSYLGTITELRPYLTAPKSVERYEKDIDRTYFGNDMNHKILKREAMSRMRILGVSEEDTEKFAKGELTKIYVDHENKRITKMEPTNEELDIVKRAESEADIPFMAYYLIVDNIRWMSGEVNTRCIIPYVWDEKWDNDSDGELTEGEAWGRVRGDMLKYNMIPCYTVNLENPEYSEFGELPYQILKGMLFTIA